MTPGRASAIGLLLITGLLLVIVARDSAQWIGEPFAGFFVWDNGTVASIYAPGWPSAAFPTNGQIVGVGDKSFDGAKPLRRLVASLPIDTDVHYRVRRRGAVLERSVPTFRLQLGDYVATLGVYLFSAGFLLLLATVAVYLRPDLLAAQVLALSSGSIALLLVLAVDFVTTNRFGRIYFAAEAFAPVAAASFALVFPRSLGSQRVRLSTILGLGCLSAAAVAIEVSAFYRAPATVLRIVQLVYLALALSAVAVVARHAASFFWPATTDERGRVAVVFAGFVMALIPFCGLVFAHIVLGWQYSYSLVGAIVPVMTLFLLFGVLWQDLFEAERYVRIGLGYAFVVAAGLVLYAGAISAFSAIGLPDPSAHPLATFAFIVALTAGADPLRRRVQVGIDRVFFRSRLHASSELATASAELAGVADRAEIARIACDRLTKALGLEWARLFDIGATTEASLETPLVFRGVKLGSLAAGPKQSGAPFSEQEVAFARALADQTALALQHASALESLREAQDARVRNERLAAIGQVAGSVAHGLRNPLAGMRAAAQVAKHRVEDSSIREILDDVLSEADRADHRVEALLDYSRPPESQPRAIQLASWLEALIPNTRARAELQDVTLGIELGPEAESLVADPGLLEDVVQELIGNALHSMPNGGKLQITSVRSGREVSLLVADTGTGIPEGVRGRLFDLFFTTRPDGTGLGLATVKKLVELQGGQVMLESTGPSGTVFRMTFPAVN